MAEDDSAKKMEDAKDYIEKHKLQDHFQAALQHVVATQPADPLKEAAKYLLEQCEQKQRWDMSVVFGNFDGDNDGKLDIHEFARAFRALGLPKRNGAKLEMDQELFKSFDTNGDGVVDLKELEAGLKPKTRRKIEEKLDAGWKFDKAAWDASCARHARWDMSKVFKQFDADGDGKLDIYELARAFRALGLEKRSGEKMDVDKVGSFSNRLAPTSAPSLPRPLP
jgi:Ca2+-binding EF-hand superfamily protein